MKKGIKNVLLGTVVVSAMMMAASCSGKKNNTIKIGGIAPLSGGVAVYGTECKNGIDLAVEEINAAGGINGQKIEFICEDDEGDSAKSVNAYKKLVTKDRVKVIIGSLTSGCTMAITNLAQAQKVVQIAPAATAVAITDAVTMFSAPAIQILSREKLVENLHTKTSVQKKPPFFTILEMIIQ